MERVVVKDIGCILNYSDDYAWQGRIIIHEDNTFEGVIHNDSKTYITGIIDGDTLSFDLIRKGGKDAIKVRHVDNVELTDRYEGKMNGNHSYRCDIFTHRNFLDNNRLNNLVNCTKERKKILTQK